ncbi:hypothetical protein M9H77_17527 [Catharanthus roseus]|uniref:Uncharacterized protein n=1 Tax=Catharanthus roseus TaxID=4058 RepID=A0ACC0B4W7_CATRO|nr:hypothetical protein M9H77_17527 [Catharanthus roseus]
MRMEHQSDWLKFQMGNCPVHQQIQQQQQGNSEEALRFMKAFDDSNELIYWRCVDPFSPVKRYLNVGCEASLKKDIKIIHHFVDELIKAKRQQLDMQLLRHKHQITSHLNQTSKVQTAVVEQKFSKKKHTTNPEINNNILQSNNGSQPNQIPIESEGHDPKNAPEKWRG